MKSFPKLSKKNLFLIFILIAVTLLFRSFFSSYGLRFSGQTMGTIYHISAVFSDQVNEAHLKAEIQKTLLRINKEFSTYDEDSVISKFNRSEGEMLVSNNFITLFQHGQALHKKSKGAWDGTIQPLVEAWGFMSSLPPTRIPSLTTIQKVKSQYGYSQLKVEGDTLIKLIPEIQLDFSSIAKGYAVDEVLKVIKKFNAKGALVDIGGEVHAFGKNAQGNWWKVGINTPDPEAPMTSVYEIITLKNKAMATSGDYRQFFEVDGKRYSHILDPRTGYPVTHNLVSVSVTAQTALLADGLATALMVMGVEKGLSLVDELDGVQALFISQGVSGELVSVSSEGFFRK